MDPVLERIDAWQHAGLIDPVTADRLRAAEREQPAVEVAPAAPTGGRAHLSLSSLFGPGVTVGEMFAYLGVGFLLGAWTAFVARLAGGSSGAGTSIGFGFAIAAAALIVIGFVLRPGDARRRRAAGVSYMLALGYIAAALTAFIGPGSTDGVITLAIVAAATFFAAVVFRVIRAALLTQAGLLLAATGLAAAVLAVVQRALNPTTADFGFDADVDRFPSLVAAAIVWLLTALALGWVGILEARTAADPGADPDEPAAADRRATLTRAWAGLVAVGGLASSLTQNQYRNDEYGRVIPAWTADLALLVLAIILVDRAFRRDSGAFLFAAGIGFVVALTDFNFTYLTHSTDVGLLVEGLILLAGGFAADRLSATHAWRARAGRPFGATQRGVRELASRPARRLVQPPTDARSASSGALRRCP